MFDNWTYEEKVSFVTKVITGEASKEELSEYEEWSQDPANRQIYEEIAEVWEAAGSTTGSRAADTDAAWEKLRGEIRTEKKTRPWVWYAAASVILLAVVSIFLLLPGGTTTYESAGQTLSVSLPDGSEVTLNVYSRLTIDEQFNENNREVQLSGEAFFDVQRDESKPFIISTEYASVEVLGTSFNVSAYEEDREIVVVVTTGKVKVTAVKKGDNVTLEKGDRGVVLKNSGTIEGILNQDVNYLSWKTKQITFEDLTLDEAVKLLEKVYQTNIELSNEALGNCTITADFNNQSIEEVLTVISASLGIEYTETQDGFELKGDGC